MNPERHQEHGRTYTPRRSFNSPALQLFHVGRSHAPASESCDENQQVFVDVRRPAIHARRRRLPQRRRLAPGNYTVWGKNLLGFGWFWAVFWGIFKSSRVSISYFQKSDAFHPDLTKPLTAAAAFVSTTFARGPASALGDQHDLRGLRSGLRPRRGLRTLF